MSENWEDRFAIWQTHPAMAPDHIRETISDLLGAGEHDAGRDAAAAGTLKNLCDMVEYLRLACDAEDNDLDAARTTLRIALERTVHVR